MIRTKTAKSLLKNFSQGSTSSNVQQLFKSTQIITKQFNSNEKFHKENAISLNKIFSKIVFFFETTSQMRWTTSPTDWKSSKSTWHHLKFHVDFLNSACTNCLFSMNIILLLYIMYIVYVVYIVQVVWTTKWSAVPCKEATTILCTPRNFRRNVIVFFKMAILCIMFDWVFHLDPMGFWHDMPWEV